MNETNTRPGSYIPCTANPGVKESYRWFFAGYNSLGDFSLQLAHSFSDPEYVFLFFLYSEATVKFWGRIRANWCVQKLPTAVGCGGLVFDG